MKNFILMALFAVAGMALAAVLPTAHTGYIGISTGALILFGGGVSEMRGSIGGTTFSRNSSGAYARNRTKPVNPNTSKQSTARIIFSYVSQVWRTLTETDRSTWNMFAPLFSRLNKLGQSIPLTGFQLYQKCNTNLKTVGGSPIAAISDVNTPVQQLIDSVLVDRSSNNMIINCEDASVAANCAMRIYATAPRSSGSKFAGPSEYRLITTITDGDTLDGVDLHSLYVPVFGNSYVVGATIGFKFDSVNLNNGINNAAQVLQSIVVA